MYGIAIDDLKTFIYTGLKNISSSDIKYLNIKTKKAFLGIKEISFMMNIFFY